MAEASNVEISSGSTNSPDGMNNQIVLAGA
jgi:hypothetical protein